MMQTLESTPRLDAAAASDLVAQYLRVLGRSSAQEIPDYPGTALESLLEHEIKELNKIIAAKPDDSPAVYFAGTCCNFMVRATFIAINESPQDALRQISDQFDDLRTDIRRIFEIT